MATVKPNLHDHRFTAGDMVEYGTRSPHGGDRLGAVVFEYREHGQDCWMIQPLSGGPDEGTLPRPYPGRMVYSRWQPERWAREPGNWRWHRTYAEVRQP